MSFFQLIAKTKCPFASNARVVLFPRELDAESLADGLRHSVSSVLRSLGTHNQEDCPDMIVVSVQSTSLCYDIASGASFLHTLLAVMYLATGRPLSSLYSGIDSLSWNFVISGTPTFVLVFAPFYHKAHIRYSHTPGTAYFCFQPDSSFERQSISSKLRNRRELSEDIRRSFESSGVYYFGNLTQNSPKSYRFIKPLRRSDPAVCWWLSPLLLDLGSEPVPAPSP